MSIAAGWCGVVIVHHRYDMIVCKCIVPLAWQRIVHRLMQITSNRVFYSHLSNPMADAENSAAADKCYHVGCEDHHKRADES